MFPCLVDMRFLGVRVDVEAANQLKKELSTREELLLHQVKKETGVDTRYGLPDRLQPFLIN